MTTRPTVLCFGDSNTHGTPAMADLDVNARFDRATRWPGVMAAALGETWTVIEEGHPGRTTVFDDPIEGAHRSGVRMLRALMESHRPVDVLVIMLGTNDLKARFSLTPADIAGGVGQLIRAAQISDTGPDGRAPAILAVAPVPIEETGVLAEMFAGGSAKSRLLADRIGAVAARAGVAFLDAGAVAAVDPLDGVHLDSAAHRAIGTAVAARVRELI